MSEYCAMCGALNDVPSRSSCSMCYGDPGSGHYYADYIRQMEEQEREKMEWERQFEDN